MDILLLRQQFVIKKLPLYNLSTKYKLANYTIKYKYLRNYLHEVDINSNFLLPLDMKRDITKNGGEHRKDKAY